MAELDDLFTGSLDNKMDFLNDEKKSVGDDGLYRIDLNKCKDKTKGWRSVIRFLPNVTKEGTIGQSAIEKISHFVNIQDQKDLSGVFDSPRNFDEKCDLTDLYWNMQNSKNAILVEKSKMLNYSKRYYSYVLVIEDEQQPELVGKIMVYQYGKTIRDKIVQEKNGEITGVPCNVFDLNTGKDFVLIVKELKTGDRTYPDYKSSQFRQESSSLPIYFEEKREFKNAPLNENGVIDPKFQDKIKKILVTRDHDLEEFTPKRLTEEQQSKVSQIINYLMGKTSNSFNQAQNAPKNEATSEDFDFENNFETETTSSVTEDADDFFSDF